MKLSLRLILLETLLLAVVVAAAFLGLGVEIRKSTERFFAAELHRSQRDILTMQNRSLEQLVWTSSLITENPPLRAAMETYRVEAAGGGGMRADLLRTIQREVERIVAGLGKDLLVVTDEHGRVLAASERGGARPAAGDDLAALPVVRRALDPTLPVDSSNFGVVELRGVYFQIGCVPIALQGFPIGTLILGERLNETFLRRLRESFDGEVVVSRQGRVLSATLPPAPDDSARYAAVFGGGAAERGSAVRLRGEDYVTAPLTLGSDAGGAPVTLHLLYPLSAALTPLDRALRFNFLLYGALAVVLAGAGAALVSRSLLAPLRGFVEFLGSVAQSGDYSRRFDAVGATPELRTLNASYDHLIDSLAHERAQLEQRTAELSAANVGLREQIQERERAEQALRTSEEQLRQAQKLEAIGTLAGGVAHDFNNLLTVIHSYVDLVLNEVDEKSRVREDLEQVKQAAQRAAVLTKQLLAFSRKQVLQPRVLDLNGVVAGVEKMLRRVIGEDIDLRTQMAPDLSRVQADPGQLEQVLMNLAVNARDAMPKGGRLTIATADVHFDEDDERPAPMPAGDWVMLSIADTGIGMDEATRARIFEPFFTTKAPGKGTGLGLSTVYGIVKQSGGFVWVTSEPGRGTTFTIHLPAVAATDDLDAPSIPQRAVRAGAETILLVEDEVQVRALARRCLQGQGYRVLVAAGAEEAERLAAAHTGPIDLLLTDVIMPAVSGPDLAAHLAAKHPRMRVLFMSGYTDEAIGQHGVLAPGIDLLEKPFTPASLARRVREILDRGNDAAARAAAAP